MGGQSRKWMALVATTWIQAFTGTNFDFSSYSSTLKSVLGISQVELNYLSVASDLGKALGWCSGVSLLYLPLWLVMFIAAFMGLFAYGLQWLLILQLISFPYFLVFLLCLLAGCSICWFNTVCYVLCIRNFVANRSLALSLTISFNGVSAALYSLIANSINPTNDSLYLFLNALVPLFTSGLALIPILRQSGLQPLPISDSTRFDSQIFFVLNVVAVVTGLYLILLYSFASNVSTARVLFGGAVLGLLLPLFIPGIVYAREWARRTIHSKLHFSFPSFSLVDVDDLDELREEFIAESEHNSTNGNMYIIREKEGCCWFWNVMEKDKLTMLGEEHPVRLLVCRWDFWLYYVGYLCGGTLGLVYSNNMAQIAESLGYYSHLDSLITLYSTCSFFGRLLSAAPDFLCDKVHWGRTGWFAAAGVPMPVAFFLLATSGSEAILQASTALIALSSGFVFATAVSITSELFGPNSAGVNHNVLITNIPIGSLLYGLLAALVYDSNAGITSQEEVFLREASVCMGRKCYSQTFVWWGCISLLGVASSFFLFLRTRSAYDHFQNNRNRTQFS